MHIQIPGNCARAVIAPLAYSCKFTLAMYEFCLNENLVNKKNEMKKKFCLSSKKKKNDKIKLWQICGIHALSVLNPIPFSMDVNN